MNEMLSILRLNNSFKFSVGVKYWSVQLPYRFNKLAICWG
jgi:hypothetical protein